MLTASQEEQRESRSSSQSHKKSAAESHQDNSYIFKALLEWRNTVKPGTASSPNQNLMSRRTRSFMPRASAKYLPQVVSNIPEKTAERRRHSKKHSDKHARPRPQLVVGQPVWIKTHPQVPQTKWKEGKVTKEVAPRSYEVDVGGSSYTRNRVHLKERLPSHTTHTEAAGSSHDPANHRM